MYDKKFTRLVMQIFTDRVQAQIEVVKEEQSRFEFDMTPLPQMIVFLTTEMRTLSARWWLSMQSLTVMSISTPLISLYWCMADTVRLAAEVRRYSVLVLQTVSEPDGNSQMAPYHFHRNYVTHGSGNSCRKTIIFRISFVPVW